MDESYKPYARTAIQAEETRLQKEFAEDSVAQDNPVSTVEQERKETKIEIDKLKIEVRNKLDKIEKLGNLEYDKDCTYCVNNPFVVDAIKTQEGLEEDKELARNYVNKINTLDLLDNGPVDNTNIFSVPDDHFFVMGDNRDNSQDSRFTNIVGYIPFENLIGKAQFIFFSLENSRFLELWKWPKAIRTERLFMQIQ